MGNSEIRQSLFMRLRMLALLKASFLLVATCLCQDTPKVMTKITTRLVEPKPIPGSFSSQVKTCWRAGTKYARVAEAPDLQDHIHGLIIVSEPDVWVINLFDKSARHIVDSGPSFDAHLPIFDVAERSKTKLSKLEFGRELDFFIENGAKKSVGESLKGNPTARYDMIMGGHQLTLWTDAKTKKPVRISLTAGAEARTIEYLGYDEGVPFDSSLFKPPLGVTVTEAK